VICHTKPNTEKSEENTTKLEYLAVYGRASMAAFRQLSTQWSKV